MAHSPKKSKSNAEKIDQLFKGMNMMLEQIQSMQKQLMNKEAVVASESDLREYVPKSQEFGPGVNTPYKVMQVAAAIPNYTIADIGPTKKVFMGNGRTFRNRKEAMDYMQRMQAESPGIQFEAFPV